MNETFLNEWRIHRHGAAAPRLAGEVPRGEADFDLVAKPGEVRIFADVNRPFVALIVEDCGLSGRRIVPVSPFSATASRREIAVGPRVYQLWNSCVASRRFTDRSWLVDTLSAEDLATVAGAIGAANPGRVTAGDGIVARYEREFLVSGGGFVPPAAPRREASMARRWFAGGWKAAASVAIGTIAIYVVLSVGRERIRAWREWARPVQVAAEDEPIELLGDVAEASSAEGVATAFPDDGALEVAELSPKAEFPDISLPPDMTVAVAGPGLEDLRRIGQAPIRPMRFQDDADFVDPCVLPQSVLDLGDAAVLMSVANGRANGGGTPPAASAPVVECRAATCPWNPRSQLLNVRAEAASAAQVEVIFDSDAVGGYRIVAGGGTRPLNAFYEVMPRGAALLADDFCQVTVKWRGESGERRKVVGVKLADVSEMEGVPERSSPVHDAPATRSAGDVKVEATL